MTSPTAILQDLEQAATGADTVTLRRLADQLGCRSVGAILAVPAALELTPIGGIPGVPTLLATVIALVACQLLIGRESLWLPGVLARQGISATRLSKAARGLRPAAQWADAHLGQHLRWLVGPMGQRCAAAAILALCLTVPALELLPFLSSVPMGVILLFALGLMTRDGRVMALAWTMVLAAVWVIWRVLV
ncbi:exopolysaccharide biosynthesis protein ExoD [Jannaschia pagri]|uniref:Exopolysaccharide biosynthesis protein ExoD n=1 Tax=Jannaschia pagri TaxID=2829797 RepID=A0ABQ4NN27_9RHOB|nr:MULTISPECIES: exopolysaccharide biosynthesis protein [unclassified Jannaschia]GIT91944.1 exopolysaccharide biosynthesis protein ExoD [Jannaschia sp. AI_61]GIT95778.1 exopolysaccharide biosynthesis protein ExoD [Jannaschia sp. AI_62]